MYPVTPPQKMVEAFEGAGVLVEFSAPEGMEEQVRPAVGLRVVIDEEGHGPTFFVLEFNDHEEWTEFKKSRRLILSFPLGSVPPFSVGAYSPELHQSEKAEQNGQSSENDQN